MKTIIVASGGGARGIVQAGALKAIHDLGIEWDGIIGSSVGTLNACLFQSGDIEGLLNIWRTIKSKDVYRFTPWKILTKEACVFDPSPLRRLLDKVIEFGLLTVSKKDLIIASTDISTWGSRFVNVHDIATKDKFLDECMASAAAPIAFPSVNNLYDAGMTSNFPVSKAIAMGADRIIVLGASVPEFYVIDSIINALDCVSSLPEFAQLELAIKFLKYVNLNPAMDKRNIELIVIKPDRPTNITLLDFDYKGKNREDLINWGYNLAIKQLT